MIEGLVMADVVGKAVTEALIVAEQKNKKAQMEYQDCVNRNPTTR